MYSVFLSGQSSFVKLVWTVDKCATICGIKHRLLDVRWGKLLDLTGLHDAVLDLLKKTERTEEKPTR